MAFGAQDQAITHNRMWSLALYPGIGALERRERSKFNASPVGVGAEETAHPVMGSVASIAHLSGGKRVPHPQISSSTLRMSSGVGMVAAWRVSSSTPYGATGWSR